MSADHPMSDAEYDAFHNARWAEVSPNMRARAVEIFDAHLAHQKPEIMRAIDHHGLGGAGWLHANHAHHGWGTMVRNLLRDNGLTDDRFPTGNLDDYYSQLIEFWVGARQEPSDG